MIRDILFLAWEMRATGCLVFDIEDGVERGFGLY